MRSTSTIVERRTLTYTASDSRASVAAWITEGAAEGFKTVVICGPRKPGVSTWVMERMITTVHSKSLPQPSVGMVQRLVDNVLYPSFVQEDGMSSTFVLRHPSGMWISETIGVGYGLTQHAHRRATWVSRDNAERARDQVLRFEDMETEVVEIPASRLREITQNKI